MIVLVLNFLKNRIWPKYPSLKQFIKYSFTGVLNTLTDFGVYFALTRIFSWFGHNYLAANAISFSLAVTQSFFINKYWTFQNLDNRNARFQYLKFFLVNIFTLGVNQLILYWLVDILGVYDLYAKVLLVISSVMINFTLVKFWVFKR
ncbi:GtrA family protein [Patescibacteria group bacterium]|nr:GtrA family protein [Patescibacteria group bacterium]